ncbi:MAG: dipeptidase [Planctomycetes bacterium]|nr:dipeptidase [Planctomycetota bacterium]
MIEKVISDIESNQDASVGRLHDLLRIPSISTDPGHKPDMARAAEWVHRLLVECGMESEIVETPGHPAVLADSGPAGVADQTVLIYGHYDVQPVGDESLWHSPAFEPTVRDGLVYARGAADDKGQVLAHLLAVESWMKVAGKLPVRIKFLIEGEEEIGSPNLGQLIREHSERLSCDYVALSDTPKFDDTTPAITYGTKGMVYKEVRLFGPKQNLHSGSFGGTLTNPGNTLAAILASLRDADNRVTIPGYYDDVRELSDQERASIRGLPFDEAGYLAATGAPGLDGERGYSTIERRWVRPTLDVNGLLSGFTGEGASTVIPAQAMAKVSMRIVPDQHPERVSAAFDQAVRSATPDTVKLELVTHSLCQPYVAPLDSAGMKAATQAMELGFGTGPVFTREGGSLPILPLFKEVLGADSLMMGLCDPNCNAHGPNEFFGLSDFRAGMRTAAYFVHLLANSK